MKKRSFYLLQTENEEISENSLIFNFKLEKENNWIEGQTSEGFWCDLKGEKATHNFGHVQTQLFEKLLHASFRIDWQ